MDSMEHTCADWFEKGQGLQRCNLQTAASMVSVKVDEFTRGEEITVDTPGEDQEQSEESEGKRAEMAEPVNLLWSKACSI